MDDIGSIVSQYEGINVIDKLNNNNIVIFGASKSGKDLKSYLDTLGVRIAAFCDNDEQKIGTMLENIEVISPQSLLGINQAEVLVCIASNWAKNIAKQLGSMGFNNYIDLTYFFNDRWESMFKSEIIRKNIDRIEAAYSLLGDNISKCVFKSLLEYRLTLNPNCLCNASYDQYFHPMVKPEENDIIIDGGAHDGRTSLRIIKMLKECCHIYAFEPEKNNYYSLIENMKNNNIDHVTTVMAGLWDNDSIGFINNSLDCSLQYFVDEKGGEVIKLICIDTFVEGKKIIPNIIKMDIEGSEKKALLGAKMTIQIYKPRLMICVYHEAEDLWMIPLYLDSIGCEYSYYLGHHTQSISETILYCK